MTLFDDEPPELVDNNSLYAIIDRRDDYLAKLSGKISNIDVWMRKPKIKLGCKSPDQLIWNNDCELLDKLIDTGDFND